MASDSISFPDVSEPTATTTISIPTFAWQAAYASVAAMALSAVLGVAFFTIGGIWGPISDLGAFVFALTMVPLVVTLHRLFSADAESRSRTVYGIGAGGVGLLLAGSGLLALNGLVTIPNAGVGLVMQFLGFGLLGIWLVAGGQLGRTTGAIRRKTATAGLASGLGMLTYPLVAMVIGFAHPALAIIGAVAIGGFILWAFWLGGELRARTTSELGTLKSTA